VEFWTGGTGLAKIRAMPGGLADAYASYVEAAREAERLGFDAYGASEHHFMYDGFMPVPLQALAAAAAVTERIRLVTGAMLLPLYDPLEAAEQAATLDVLSGGRLILGLGMGYRPLEFDGLGTAKRTRGVRLVEGMQVVERATSNERFSFAGDHYRYDDVVLHPAPVQRPIPMWLCGGTSTAAARRAGEAGVPYWLANSPFERIEVIVEEYRRVGRAAGWPEERLRVGAFKDVCLGDSVAEAEMLRQVFIDAFYEEHILGYGYLVDDEGQHVYNPPRDHPMYQRFLDGIYCGTVEMVTDEFKRYEALGIDTLFLASPQRELIAAKIMPEFERGG
jgi:alkanesulfonate monooxygenase SsuD/methylene tetrahydromethanopterin reductase-like flavin-dependent oxidoreductase (luciferase family)